MRSFSTASKVATLNGSAWFQLDLAKYQACGIIVYIGLI
jgi:hypothetical protein